MGPLLLSEPTLASRFKRKKKKKGRGGEERRGVKWKRKGKKEHALARSRFTQYLYPRAAFLNTGEIIKAKYLDPRVEKFCDGMNS